MPYNYVIQRQVGTVSEVLPVWVGNVTTGVGIANVVASTVGFGWYRNDMAAVSSGTCTTGTLGSYSVSSWVQANSTSMLGWYNFGIPNSVFVSGRSAAMRLSSATMPELNIFIELTKTDNQTFFSSQALSTNALVNINQILGSTPVTSAAGMFTVNVSTIHAQTAVTSAPGIFSANVTTIHSQPAVTSAPGVFSANITTILGTTAVTQSAGIFAYTFDLGRTANLTSTVALTGTSVSTNQLVNLNQILGSTPVTTAAGVQAVAWDLGRTANLTSTIALTGTTISTNQVVNVGQILGSAPVTTAAGLLAYTFDLGRTANATSTLALTGLSIAANQSANVNQILGSAPVTTAAGVVAVAWDLGRTANLTSTIALTGTTVSTNQLVNVNRILGSAPVTTAAGIFSVGMTGTQTFDITGSLTGSVGSVVGLNAAFIDVSILSRLAAASYTAPLSASDTRSAVGLASANLDTQLAAIATSTGAVQAKTDGLVFTSTGLVDVNLKAIKEKAITGDGSATPFDVLP